MYKKVKNYLNWYNVKKMYFDRDFIIYWDLNPTPKYKLIRLLSKELRVWIDTNTQSFLVDNKITYLVDTTIRIKKSDNFYDAKNLEFSSGVLDVELVIDYYDYDGGYKYHSIETSLIFANGKIK